MHVDVIGDGAPLVLLHGWAMHGGVYAPLVEVLAAHYRCYVVDLPGHGLSDERDGFALHAVSERLLAQLPPAVWLGWSLGGLIAQRAAIDAPDRVRALVAVAATPRFVVAPDWPGAVPVQVFEQFARDLARDYRATIERFLALEVHGDAQARAEIRWLRQRLAERPPGDPAVLGDVLRMLASTDLRGELGDLRLPSLWFAGQHDRLVPSAGMRAAAALCGGEFLMIERAGHAPFLSQPARVAEAIHRLHARLPAA